MTAEETALLEALMRFIIPILLVSILGMAGNVFLGLAVYNDAQYHQNDYAMLWGVLSGFFPICALIYVIVKASTKPKAVLCLRCGCQVPRGYPACPRCGQPMALPPLAPEIADNYRKRRRLFLTLWIVSMAVVILVSIVVSIVFVGDIFRMAAYYTYD